jgi:hypothetical protein|mmetsp:Transcript_24208/g.32451  ORF Transcript_24208/g.32451 Transcript_24208/m.32451 type:complete len:92 (+) Transcript_24208:1726-2001(+)
MDPRTGQTVDAATGKAVKVDPASGKTVDAVTGEPLTVRDTITGQVVDAATGNPVTKDPFTGRIVVVEEPEEAPEFDISAGLNSKSTAETQT